MFTKVDLSHIWVSTVCLSRACHYTRPGSMQSVQSNFMNPLGNFLVAMGWWAGSSSFTSSCSVSGGRQIEQLGGGGGEQNRPRVDEGEGRQGRWDGVVVVVVGCLMCQQRTKCISGTDLLGHLDTQCISGPDLLGHLDTNYISGTVLLGQLDTNCISGTDLLGQLDTNCISGTDLLGQLDTVHLSDKSTWTLGHQLYIRDGSTWTVGHKLYLRDRSTWTVGHSASQGRIYLDR